MVELDFERNPRKVLGGKLERGLGQFDAVIVLDLGAGERVAHLARIAAGNVEKGERLRDRLQRAMENRPHLLMGERVGIHQLLIGRPLLLELLERGFVGHRALGVEVMNVDVHSRVASRPPDQAF